MAETRGSASAEGRRVANCSQEGHHRLDSVGEKFVDEVVVELETETVNNGRGLWLERLT